MVDTQSIYIPDPFVFGQASVLQSWVFSVSPVHSSPPLVLVRVIFCWPPPHVTEQSVNSVQFPQTHSSEIKYEIWSNKVKYNHRQQITPSKPYFLFKAVKLHTRAFGCITVLRLVRLSITSPTVRFFNQFIPCICSCTIPTRYGALSVSPITPLAVDG